jgi:alpha-glucosidase
MQWNANANAGFSTVAPWLPVAADYTHENVVNLTGDKRSILNLYRALIRLRKQHAALVSGSYRAVAAQGDLLLYRREGDGEVLTVALNLGDDPVELSIEGRGLDGDILLSTHLDRAGERIHGTLDLRGNEGVVIGKAS